MALRVWLPLNGDVVNKGMIGGSFTVGTTPTYVDGKIGKALSTGSLTMSAEQTSSVLNNEAVSFAFWIKVVGTERKMIFGNDGMGANNNRKFSIFQYPTINDLHISWMNDAASATFFGDVFAGVFPTDVWTHCAITYDNPTRKIYINGVLKDTKNAVSNSSTFAYQTQLIHNSSGRLLNDFRIYDHCLSAKEVKELSKGLILHYKLDGNGVGQPNLLINSSLTEGKLPSGLTYATQNSVTSNTWTKDGAHLITPNGGNANNGFQFRFNDFTSIGLNFGDTVTFSVDVKGTSDTNIPTIGITYNLQSGQYGWYGTGAVTKKINLVDLKENEYTRYSITQTIPTSSSSYTSKMIFFQMMGNIQSDLYFKNIKIEIGTIPTPWCPNSADALYNKLGFNSTIEKDCSGFGYDGTDSGTITVSSDSSRHCASTNFASGFIKTATLPTNMYQMSVSFWVKLNATNNYIALFIPNGNPTHSNGVWLSVNCESCKVWAYQGGNAPNYTKGASGALDINKWYHCVYVFDNGKARWYLNGETCGNEVTYTGRTYIAGNIQFTLGDSYTGTNWGGTPFNGNLSDFRIYATALSADDIKQLYKVSAMIDNNNNIFADDFIEEGKFHINSRSIVKSSEFGETFPLMDMAVKTLSDGSTWARIFYHNNKGGTVLFSSVAEAQNTQTEDKYSRLYLLPSMKGADGKYEFMLCYPNDTTAYNRWKQTNNPCDEYVATTSSGTGVAEGYEAVSIAWTGNYWGGLTRQNSSATSISSCYLSGSVGHSNWFYAIGANSKHQNGIPTNSSVGGGSTASVAELWVRVDTIKSSKVKVFANSLKVNSINEV